MYVRVSPHLTSNTVHPRVKKSGTAQRRSLLQLQEDDVCAARLYIGRTTGVSRRRWWGLRLVFKPSPFPGQEDHLRRAGEVTSSFTVPWP